MKELHLIAHNLRSRENVGALFRLSDGLGVKKLWLTGYTPKPPHIRIEKASLGAEKTVIFEYNEHVEEVLHVLRKTGFKVFALEHVAGATPLSAFQPLDRLALILGTETTGVPASLLTSSDGAVFIPMRGKKTSFNVAMAAAIAGWYILSP